MVNEGDLRLFSIQPYCDEFVTGICADGRQVVMGLICPNLVAYFFDNKGRLLGCEHREWNKPPPKLWRDGPNDINDGAFQDGLAEQQNEWQGALGFRAATIKVQ